ncbi:MAG TPA: serine/threonine-protein kinase [Micromonosporaceae bacterium]|nr:serine/threonine-protein kinase [Micromonosporaceae bacterium]
MRTLNDRYELEQRIGVGGMSEVWRARDRVLARPVAVKLIAPGHADQPESLERIRSEARAAARLVHPNVASVHDFGLSPRPGQQVPYLVMELVEGETLAAHLAARRIDWRISVRICAEVCAALAAAHAENIVHRDIKPANIMLTPAGVKVLDFGIAASAGELDPGLDGTVVGTPAFVAPERFDGVPATPATDMYAVGVLLHLCLAHTLPWAVDTALRLGKSGRHRRPEPLPPIEGLPPDVAALCRQCLARSPEARPTSMAAALLLAESVGAQVYVPLADLPAPRPRPAAVSPWDERAANAATDFAGADNDLPESA